MRKLPNGEDTGGERMTYAQCNGKNKYSQAEAKRAKAFVGEHRHKDVRIYECPNCHGYHLTKRND